MAATIFNCFRKLAARYQTLSGLKSFSQPCFRITVGLRQGSSLRWAAVLLGRHRYSNSPEKTSFPRYDFGASNWFNFVSNWPTVRLAWRSWSKKRLSLLIEFANEIVLTPVCDLQIKNFALQFLEPLFVGCVGVKAGSVSTNRTLPLFPYAVDFTGKVINRCAPCGWRTRGISFLRSKCPLIFCDDT